MPIKPRTARSLLALMLALACASAASADALAATGGASAPSAGKRGAKARIHSTGVATWFGPGFYGKKTACGQTLTPILVGIANRTLPCGTLISVTYAGRRLTVPVIDRGPYSFADWDLTAGAAQALGISETVRIRTRIVGSAANSPTLGQPEVPAALAATGGVSAG